MQTIRFKKSGEIRVVDNSDAHAFIDSGEAELYRTTQVNESGMNVDVAPEDVNKTDSNPYKDRMMSGKRGAYHGKHR